LGQKDVGQKDNRSFVFNKLFFGKMPQGGSLALRMHLIRPSLLSCDYLSALNFSAPNLTDLLILQ
jgi:hypothetical protein